MDCNKLLHYLDLIPLISWVRNKTKCRYCKSKISSIYPLLEISTWLLFTLIWVFLIDYNLIFSFNSFEIFKLLFWLIIWFISILYSFYDILFLEVHDGILLTGIIVVVIWLWLQTLINDLSLISTLSSGINNLYIWIYSILITILILWSLYIIMLNWLSDFLDILLLVFSIIILFFFIYYFNINIIDITIINWLIWALIFFIFFYLQILVSWWKWMWWWDLRIGIFVWLILWLYFSFTWLMLTYFVWSLIWISLILFSKIKWIKANTQVPFWPFICIWFFLTIFFSIEVSKLTNLFFN